MSSTLSVVVGPIELATASIGSWYITPNRDHVLFIASRRPLPWYEVQLWYAYMSTVKDLLSAGF